jgi:hypothetical protein
VIAPTGATVPSPQNGDRRAFYEAGHIYQLSDGYSSGTVYFKCTSIEIQPGSQERYAFGWERTGNDRTWRPASLDELDFRTAHNGGWSDVTYKQIHLTGCSAGRHPDPDAACLCEDTPVLPGDHIESPTVANEVV